MYEHLNTRTREIVVGLCEGKTVKLGGNTVNSFSSDQAKVLSILANNLSELKDKRGQELVERFIELIKEDLEDKDEEETKEQKSKNPQSDVGASGYRIGLLRAHSFRGLAPAGQEWEYDFEGKSHLLYGPNGCGKSSLLGAISWCLTGRIFRDDQPPETPQDVKVYSTVGRKPQSGERPDALALMDKSGNNTAASDKYWVEVQLIRDGDAGGLEELWVRRHSKEGLSMLKDSPKWVSIGSIQEADIDELDAELNLLMPARISHISFGRDAELIRIFSKMIGLDDVETIADLAARLCSALRREATTVEKGEVAQEKKEIEKFIQYLSTMDFDVVKTLDSYAEVMRDTRGITDVKSFGKAIGKAIEDNKEKLAEDLGIEIPAEGSPEFTEFGEKLDNLPGQVQSAVEELSKPINEIFPNSIGFSTPTEKELVDLEQRLEKFQDDARQQIKERLEWALKEKQDKKVTLMLLAAEQLSTSEVDRK